MINLRKRVDCAYKSLIVTCIEWFILDFERLFSVNFKFDATLRRRNWKFRICIIICIKFALLVFILISIKKLVVTMQIINIDVFMKDGCDMLYDWIEAAYFVKKKFHAYFASYWRFLWFCNMRTLLSDIKYIIRVIGHYLSSGFRPECLFVRCAYHKSWSDSKVVKNLVNKTYIF